MLQRSPTYIGAKPSVDPVANKLSAWFGYWAARWWFILSSMTLFILCKLFPERAKQKMRADIQNTLGDKFEAKHFTPSYDPWDQRVCLCPDADFFEAIKVGKASIETDTIKRFHAKGIELNSGKQLKADLVVAATGLKIQFFGGINIDINGEALAVNQTYVYKGMMLSGLPNTFMAVGYTNASWTLKVDLTHHYATRLINHMDRHGYQLCVPKLNRSVNDSPLLNLSSSYIQRATNELPKQGSRKPWRLNQNYVLDTIALKYTRVVDDEMEFS